MKKKLTWRLGKLPTPDEVRELVKDKIITQDEARGILFSHESETERDEKSLEAEIKFLRELVQKLSNSKTTIVETIREVEVPYKRYNWYEPYKWYCDGSNIMLCQTNAINSTTGTAVLYTASSDSVNTADDFTKIKTF